MAEKSSKRSGLYDYLNWRGDISFESLPVCEVDNLIFSLISYIDLGEAAAGAPTEKNPILHSVTRSYLKSQKGIIQNIGLVIPRDVVTLLVRASKTERFGLTRPFGYVNRVCDEEQKQFSAVCFALPDGSTFIAFRGTDDTLVGWKENFNMSFMYPVPAQTEALLYLEDIARGTKGKIYLGGHSKGGNLAVFSAAKASGEVKERISAVYSNDGPGFSEGFLLDEGYEAVKDRIHTLVPQSSVVGMLLEQDQDYTVVKSSFAGIQQHNGMSWEVMGGSFIHLDDTDEESKSIDRSMKEWLSGISNEERATFVDSLFEALSSANVKTLSELNADKLKLLKAWGSMTPEARNYLIRCIELVFLKRTKIKS